MDYVSDVGVCVGKRVEPAIFQDLRDDLVVEVDLHMRRRGLTLRDLRRFGYSHGASSTSPHG
ncbi:hypothetical protein [Jiella sp. M17.18]|uniref:hypothetical protein n=1 Tax=Jiella sp. M17.18 TaxID=3234247 RepID=UPI0034DE233E